METKKLHLLLIFCSFFLIATTGFSQNNEAPNLDIDKAQLENLDGAYSIISILDNGVTQQFSIKIRDGKILSIVIDGEEIPQDRWIEHKALIKEQIKHLSPEKQKNYKYQEIYDIETDIKRDLEKLERSIQDLEISRRMDKFYEEDLKEWVIELEQELNESEVLKEVENVLDDIMKELDRFLSERKDYQKKK